MAFINMYKTLAGEVPGVPESLARNKINDALGKIYDETDWSFQSRTGAFLASAVISTGTFTATVGSNQVIGNAAATTALAAVMTLGHIPFITSLQFRSPSYSLYNIIAADVTTNAPFVTLTLDRVWMEPVSGAGLQYFVYQAYFPVPVSDFTKFVEIRDTTNAARVSFWTKSQDDLARDDPQRLIFGPCVPTFAVPFQIDQRTGSTTYGYLMYELWPHVLADVAYTFSYRRSGPLLSADTDTLQYPLSEELVTWRAKEVLYQWKESQKGDQMQRGSGADWRFLAQGAAAEYKEVLKKIRAKDANLHRDFLTRNNNQNSDVSSDGYSTEVTGMLNIGRF